MLGLIGGAPTFLGTVLGQAWSSEAVTVLFFAIAAGSILYVVQELFNVNRKYGHTVLVDVARPRGHRARLRDRLRRHGRRHLSTARSARTAVASASKPASRSQASCSATLDGTS